jgi:uncharacterized protein YqfA (UPF0365 family)
VGEGIVSTIGSAETHKDVLENPDNISKTVMARGLDAGTAFEILSIDIADVDVGENIGAKLQADQAEADKRASRPRPRSAARWRSPRSRSSRPRSRRTGLVVLAEAEVPKAMAEAFRSGNMGIMDYFKLKNIEADTRMRQSFGEGEKGQAGDQNRDN